MDEVSHTGYVENVDGKKGYGAYRFCFSLFGL